MWRNIASNALSILILGCFLLAGIVVFGGRQYSASGPLANGICIEVPRGSNMREVSAELRERGAISSLEIYRIGTEYAGKNPLLKAGSFLIPARASMSDIAEILTRGGASSCGTEVVYRIGINRLVAQVRKLDPESGTLREVLEFAPAEGAPPAFEEIRSDADMQYRIAIAEGATSWQILTSLEAIGLLEADVEDLPTEGSLAPSSYQFSPGDPISGLVERMQSAQADILLEAWNARAPDLPFDDPNEALILASIVEKETGLPDERGHVASVFVNRLRRSMKLQTDPTVIYGITLGEGILGRGLRQSELRRKTPFNTYVIEGLPPTPIANPGRTAILATLNPDRTDSIFFVADGTGGHAFAATLEEHERNVEKWREIEAERADGN